MNKTLKIYYDSLLKGNDREFLARFALNLANIVGGKESYNEHSEISWSRIGELILADEKQKLLAARMTKK